MENTFLFTSNTKINFRWIYDLKVERQNLKPFRKSREYLWDFKVGKDLPHKTLKEISDKGKD